jgi:hypothetical protein
LPSKGLKADLAKRLTDSLQQLQNETVSNAQPALQQTPSSGGDSAIACGGEESTASHAAPAGNAPEDAHIPDVPGSEVQPPADAASKKRADPTSASPPPKKSRALQEDATSADGNCGSAGLGPTPEAKEWAIPPPPTESEKADAAEGEEAPPGEEKEVNKDAQARTASASVLTAPSDDWMYLDKAGAEQGPFSTEQMKQWSAAGYLDPTLQVKHPHTGAWLDLGAVLELQPAPSGPPAPQPAGVGGAYSADFFGGGGGGHGGHNGAIPEGKVQGEVKNWNDEKGFGFIVPDGM